MCVSVRGSTLAWKCLWLTQHLDGFRFRLKQTQEVSVILWKALDTQYIMVRHTEHRLYTFKIAIFGFMSFVTRGCVSCDIDCVCLYVFTFEELSRGQVRLLLLVRGLNLLLRESKCLKSPKAPSSFPLSRSAVALKQIRAVVKELRCVYVCVFVFGAMSKARSRGLWRSGLRG